MEASFYLMFLFINFFGFHDFLAKNKREKLILFVNEILMVFFRSLWEIFFGGALLAYCPEFLIGLLPPQENIDFIIFPKSKTMKNASQIFKFVMKCSKLSKSSLKLQILKSKSDSRILKI
jgi:hypothetical protein